MRMHSRGFQYGPATAVLCTRKASWAKSFNEYVIGRSESTESYSTVVCIIVIVLRSQFNLLARTSDVRTHYVFVVSLSPRHTIFLKASESRSGLFRGKCDNILSTEVKYWTRRTGRGKIPPGRPHLSGNLKYPCGGGKKTGTFWADCWGGWGSARSMSTA